MHNVQITHQLLRQCFSHMVRHLSRTTPSHLMRELLESFDSMKKEIFQKVTSSSTDNVAWSQACLGLGTGGLGYQDAQRVSHCAYISGVFQNSTSLTLLDPSTFDSGTTTEAFKDSMWITSQNMCSPDEPVEYS